MAQKGKVHDRLAVSLAESLRRHDPDRYLTTLFAPGDRREGLIALYSFNFEIAKIRETVREPLLGEIRLQWWREAIDAIYAGTPARKHEVTLPLAETIRRFGLTRYHFDRLIDSRAADLDETPQANLAGLKNYAENTSSRLIYLALEVLGARAKPAGDGRAEPGHDGSFGLHSASLPNSVIPGLDPGISMRWNAGHEAARHIGIAWTLVGLIRALPAHIAARRQVLPAELLSIAGLEAEAVFARKAVPGLIAIVESLAGEARKELEQARRLHAQTPRAALSALMPAVLARAHLRRLERAAYDPLDPILARPDSLASWRLSLASLSGRY